MIVNRTTLFIVLLIAGAGVTSWLRHSLPDVANTDDAKPLPQADFFLDHFQIRQYDVGGQPDYELHGKRLDHYPDSDQAVIETPVILMRNAGNPAWQIHASRAVLMPETEDLMQLSGNVKIQRPPTALTAALTLESDALSLKPKAERIDSDSRVTLSSSGSTVVAEQMHADLKQGSITLLQVRGRYDP